MLKTTMSSVPNAAPASLQKLPSELRLMIFDIVTEGDGTIPPLLEALIGDCKMYMEAIEVLWKKSPIPLSFLVSVPVANALTKEEEKFRLITKLAIE